MSNGDENTLSRRFDFVGAINLRDRSDRLRQVRKEVSSIGQSMSAVTLFLAEKPLDRGKFQSRGERGCFESHLSIWRRALAGGATSVCILEDDVKFAPDFERHVSILDRLPDNWGIFYGGAAKQGAALSWGQGVRNLRRLDPDEEFIGLHFYAINGRCLPGLIQCVETFASRNSGHPDGGPMPIDGALNVFRSSHESVEAYLVQPALALQRSSKSDIAATKWFDKISLLKSPLRIAREIKDFFK